MRRLVIGLLSLTLSGCWIGEGLYSNNDARIGIEPGVYRMSAQSEPPQVTRVTLLANGMTQMTDKDGADVYGLVPLDPATGRFAVWFNDKDQKGSAKPAQFYFLGQKHADGSFTLYMPECSGEEAEIARRAAAVVEEASGVSACRFKSRASLETALRQLHPTDENRLMVLLPIKR